jgi:hypothetical protein
MRRANHRTALTAATAAPSELELDKEILAEQQDDQAAASASIPIAE